MGYGRLSRGRSSVIVDCAAPPAGGKGGRTAHASTLAFEMTVGRRPFIVSSGPGCSFGPDWCAAGRATAAHSTLVVAEASSARFAAEVAGPDVLTEGPRVVEADLGTDRPAARLVAAHSGYAGSHGLIHVRRLDLSLDGGALRGEDLLSAVTEAEKRRFVQARAAAGRQSGAGPGHGLPFAIRFHLHPDVDAELDPALGVVRLMLGNGDGWTFRHASACTIGLDPGVYLEKTRAEPAAARQIVLSGLAMHHATSVKWSLTRDGTAPAFLREVPRIGVEADHEPTSALEDPR